MSSNSNNPTVPLSAPAKAMQDRYSTLNPSANAVNSIIAEGTVVKLSPYNNIVYVSIPKSPVIQAKYVTPFMCSYLGLNMYTYPGIGDNVVLLRDTKNSTAPAWILAVNPKIIQNGDKVSQNHVGIANDMVNTVGDEERKFRTSIEKDPTLLSGGRPLDLADYESTMGVPFGPVVEFLQTLVRLKASDLAKIECYLLDDFVRIVSQNFQHISAFGNFDIISNDGSLDVIWTGSYDECDTFGKGDNREPKGIEISGEKVQNLTSDNIVKEFYKDGRWRFRQYIGKLGNIFHLMITEPMVMLGKNPDGSENRSGTADIYTGSDGTVLVRSIAEIALEKVVRIPVPVFKVKPEELDVANANLDAYAQWEPPDNNKLWEVSYMIKDYNRWLSNYYVMAAFQSFGVSKVNVPAEFAVTKPEAGHYDQRLTSLYSSFKAAFGNYLTKYATIRIFRDGSIMCLDGYGSTIHMTNGNVNISSHNDLFLEASGLVNITGRDINLLARDNVEVSAIKKRAVLKGGSGVDIYCQKGPILIQSEMDMHKTSEQLESIMDDEDIERVQEAEGSGIVLKTPWSNILVTTRNAVILQVGAYLNKALSIAYKTTKFIIDKIATFSLGQVNISSALVYVNTLRANAISNRTAIRTITGQYGLTAKHDDDENTERNEIVGELDDEFNTAYTNALFEDIAPSFTFQYKSLNVPTYYEIHESVSQQLIRCEDYKATDTLDVRSFEEYSYFGDPLYGSSLINYPIYPGDPTTVTFKRYMPKITTSINDPCLKSGSELKASALQGKVAESKVKTWFRKGDIS